MMGPVFPKHANNPGGYLDALASTSTILIRDSIPRTGEKANFMEKELCFLTLALPPPEGADNFKNCQNH